MYSFVVYLYVNDSGSITSVGEERANLSAVVYVLLCGFCIDKISVSVMPLAILCGCTARFMMDLVGNPKDRFSHNEAHFNPYLAGPRLI